MLFGDVEDNVLTIFNVTSTRTIQIAGEARAAIGLLLNNRKFGGIFVDSFSMFYDKTTGIALEGTLTMLSGAVSVSQKTIATNLFVLSPPPDQDDILAIINSILALKGVKQFLLIIGVPMVPIGCLVVLHKKDPETLPY
jgi:hypothetical protein